MAFQFQCPQGHLLEAEPTQIGQHCQCPMCGAGFYIPAPAGMEMPGPALQPFVPAGSAAEPEPESPLGGIGGPLFSQANQPAKPKLWHIPCPQGHQLEVPEEMLDQHAMCPHCQTQFQLRERDSVEYKQQRQREMEMKDFKSGKAWFTWAIVFAVLVLIGLVIMIAISANNAPAP